MFLKYTEKQNNSSHILKKDFKSITFQIGKNLTVARDLPFLYKNNLSKNHKRSLINSLKRQLCTQLLVI